MGWQSYILAQTILVALSIICLRILARDKEYAKASFVINACLYVFLYVVFLALSPWLGAIHMAKLHEYWWRFIVGGLAFALTNVFTYKTLVYFDAAVATIAGTLNAFFTIFFAAIVLGEVLTTLQIIGAIVLVLAISYSVLATRAMHKKIGKNALKMGLLYATLAGITYAFADVNEKSLLQDMNIGTYVIFGVGGQLVMAVIIALIFQRKKFVLLLRPRVIGWSALGGTLRGLGGVCFILSEVKSNNVALVTVISSFKLIVVIFLGWWLLGERKYIARKLVSAGLAIAGLTVMFWP